MDAERTALFERVYPKLRSFARELGGDCRVCHIQTARAA